MALEEVGLVAQSLSEVKKDVNMLLGELECRPSKKFLLMANCRGWCMVAVGMQRLCSSDYL